MVTVTSTTVSSAMSVMSSSLSSPFLLSMLSPFLGFYIHRAEPKKDSSISGYGKELKLIYLKWPS